MKIELRNIKYAAFASQETSCFSATVYIDGANAGTVENAGHGGCNFYHPPALGDRLNEYAKTLPEQEVSGLVEDDGETPVMMQPDADTLIGDVFDAAMAARDLKRLLASKIVIVAGGSIRTTKKIPAADMARMLAAPDKLKAMLKADAILNLMPFADALALYRKHG